MRWSGCCAASAAGDNADGEVRAGPRPAPTEERASAVDTVPEPGTTATSATLLPGRWTQELAADFTSAALDVLARRVMYQVWRAGAKAGIPSEHTLPEDGPVAGGVALVADEDGPRAAEVSAGAGHGAVAAGGGQQLVAELLHQRSNSPRWRPICSGERMPDQLSSGLRRP